MQDQRAFPLIETERLLLTVPPAEDALRMLAFAQVNREHLAPWSPLAPVDYYTESYWRHHLEVARTQFMRDQSMRLVMFRRDDAEGEAVGVCNFSNIVRGPFQACYLGYNLDHRAVGTGLMSEALRAAIKYAFESLRLHRIMANYIPTNVRSGRLLRRLGFVVEGYARDYLFIAGSWQDHVLTSLTNHKLEIKR